MSDDDATSDGSFPIGDDRSMKELREDNPSGLLHLFLKPDMRFALDALLGCQPRHEFTESELASLAGLDEDTVDDIMPTLMDAGVVRVAGDETYQIWSDGPTVRVLHELNGLLNRLGFDEAGETVAEVDALPEQSYTYTCPECDERGKYVQKVLTGHEFTCPECPAEWVFPGGDPPAYVERWNARFAKQDVDTDENPE